MAPVLNGQAPGSFPPIVLLAEEPYWKVIGFVEVGLRSHADGCGPARPVGFIEGWYVTPGYRRQKVGTRLIAAAEHWARTQGCREMASDTWIDALDSQRAHEALGQVGLAHRGSARPTQLSGGERQRVAIARALAGQPAIVLADEPTGNLDSVNSQAILALLEELNSSGATILVITHEREIAGRLPRQIEMLDGRIVADSVRHLSSRDASGASAATPEEGQS